MLSTILFFTIIVFIVYQIVEDNKIKERHEHRNEATNLIMLSTHVVQSIARYEMLKHSLQTSENILFPDEIEEINNRIDNALRDVGKYTSKLRYALYTNTVFDSTSHRLLNVTCAIDDQLKVLKSKKNESFDDAITDELIHTVNDIQRSVCIHQ